MDYYIFTKDIKRKIEILNLAKNNGWNGYKDIPSAIEYNYLFFIEAINGKPKTVEYGNSCDDINPGEKRLSYSLLIRYLKEGPAIFEKSLSFLEL